MTPIDYLVKFFPLLLIGVSGLSMLEMYESKMLELETDKKTLAQKERDIKRKTKELAEVKRFEQNLEDSKRRVEDVLKQIETVQKQLPAEINDTEVNGTLSGIATGLKMLDPAPRPKAEVNNNFYFSKEYNFDVQGTFLQGLIFFEKLENLSSEGRILNVKYVRFSESKAGDARSRFKILNLSSVVEAFRYNPNYRPDK